MSTIHSINAIVISCDYLIYSLSRLTIFLKHVLK